MKFIIITLMALHSALTFAMQTDLILPGKPGGSMAEFGKSYQNYLEKNGVSVNAQILGSWAAGSNQYELSNKPSILIWASPVMAQSRQSGKIPTYTIPEKNFVSVLIRERYMICSRADKNLGLNEFLNGKNVKVGYFSYHENFVLALDKVLDTASFKPIPYSGSSARMKGLVSGDVDYIFISTKQAIRATAEGTTNCFLTTSPANSENPLSSTSLESIVPDFKMNTFSVEHFILAKNFTDDEMNKLRRLTATFVNSEFWKKYLLKAGSDSVTENNTVRDARKSVDLLTPDTCQAPWPCKQ